MLQSVRNYLSLFGKPDKKILKIIEKTDRKDFMDENKSLAYLDKAISIGHDQTISQPSTVARMLSLLNLKKNRRNFRNWNRKHLECCFAQQTF